MAHEHQTNQLSDLKPGPELDKAVAIHVFNLTQEPFGWAKDTRTWKYRQWTKGCDKYLLAHGPWGLQESGQCRTWPIGGIPSFSREMGAAWWIAEYMDHLGDPLALSLSGSDVVALFGRSKAMAVAKTAPHAICLAALRAAGVGGAA